MKLELMKERKGFFNKSMQYLGKVSIQSKGEFEAKTIDIIH